MGVSSPRRRIGQLAAVAAMAAAFSAATAWLYESPYLLALLALPLPFLLGLFFSDRRHALLLGLGGALIGPATEAVCVAGGLWTYTETGGIPLIPPWHPPGWACFPLAITLVVTALRPSAFSHNISARTVVLLLLGLAFETAVFVILGTRTFSALIFALAASVFLLAIWRNQAVWLTFLSGLLVGPLTEALPIRLGAWSYARDEFLGMPYYMPLAYGLYAVLLGFAAHGLAQALRRAPK